MQKRIFFFVFFFFFFSPLVLSSVLWNGNLNDYVSSADLNAWSFNNPTQGEWQAYIYGNVAPFQMSTFVTFDPTFKNPADLGSAQGMQIMINGSSFWNHGSLERTELIANNAKPLQTGDIFYKWSMMASATNFPSSAYEHQLVFFEAHFADIKFGGPAAGNLQWFPAGQAGWSTPLVAGVWHNFALEVNYGTNQISLYHATGADVPVLVAGPVSASVSQSDFHVGILRVQDSNGQQGTNVEMFYYSGCQIVSSTADFAFSTVPAQIPTGANLNTPTANTANTPNSPATPSSPNTPNTPNTPAGQAGNVQGSGQNGGSGGISGGGVAGIVIALLIVLGVAAGAGYFVWRRRRHDHPITYQYQSRTNTERNELPTTYVPQSLHSSQSPSYTPQKTPTYSPSPSNEALVAKASSKPLPPLPPAPGSTANISTRQLPPAPAMKTTGSTVMATYSGDGKKYKAIIEDVKPGYYLVRYVDFGNDREWLPTSAV